MLQLKKTGTIVRVSQVILGLALLGVISCASSAPGDNSMAESQIYFGDQIQQFQRMTAIRERRERLQRENVARSRAETLEAWLALQHNDGEAERLEVALERIRNANRDRSLKTHFDEWMWINR